MEQYTYPKIDMTSDQKKWLEKVYNLNINSLDHLNNYRMIKSELTEEIPPTFDPNQINRLLLNKMDHHYQITLLGILHISPDSPYINYCDTVITTIKNKLILEPNVTKIDCNELGEELKINSTDMKLIIELIAPLDNFWSSRTLGPTRNLISIDRDENFDAFTRYVNIEDLVTKNYTLRLYAPNNKSDDKSMNTVEKRSNTKYKLFLSHAHKDQQLVEHFLDFFQTSFNTSRGDIYCTSKGDISFGESFTQSIKEHLIDAELIILLITPNYLVSKFCLIEMGAAWAINKKVCPILVNPISSEDLYKFTPFGNIQTIRLNNKDDLFKLSNDLIRYKIISSVDNSNLLSKVNAFLEKITSQEITTKELSSFQANGLSMNDRDILTQISNVFTLDEIYNLTKLISSLNYSYFINFYETSNIDRLFFYDFEFNNSKLEELKINFLEAFRALYKVSKALYKESFKSEYTDVMLERAKQIEITWNELFKYIKELDPSFLWIKTSS
ncbi:toll/interleukin-1 receptor domain-containing protein [Paenibacillus rigui]|uniref:TIR domain-containing protein n=1 Tax=Paenibacillus rigui TaxID=554312 RepID=A0A229UNV5_9BACL|nr:toll/interleukin-1 receptor domain-containing protein [Paenibacillus rigui]OXM84579.1 hypothetical protein CF651_18900 [Paenibacillus rigui]